MISVSIYLPAFLELAFFAAGFVVAFTFGCAPWLLLPAVSGASALEIAAFILAFFLVQVGLGLWGVLTISFRQAITPNYLLGRVNASMRFTSYGLGALGLLLSGLLASLFGMRETLWLAAAGFLAILLVTLLATPLPRIRAIPTAPAPPDASSAEADKEILPM